MGSFWIAVAGFVMIALAVAININTSMGGTRSDHSDGSSFLAGVGAFVTFAGLIAMIWEITLA